MKVILGVKLKPGSYEEILPDFSPEFPYIASYVELDQHMGRQSPWHWHKEVELFYMEKGALEYDTPGGKMYFPEGSGGFVNSNVLHMSRAKEGVSPVISLLHLFHPLLISGQQGSLIDRKYVAPLILSPGAEIVGFYPDRPEHGQLLALLQRSFELSEQDEAYEIRLRAVLSELWCLILTQVKSLGNQQDRSRRSDERVKMMMAYVHKHCGEKMTVEEVASAAFLSERECYRIFQECLNLTPVEYITVYRIQRACYMLAEGDEPITVVAIACGLGSSSYFGKIFRERIGCSPLQYRKKWRNSDIK